ncbi:MAG: peptide deformylase [Thermotogota bacterium]|nr:peptide deformylase [Thermotogota bacterium]
MKKNKANLLPIRIVGDKVLRKKAKKVEKMDNEVLDFIQDLTYTMYKTDGVGLAAPQVGKSIRIFVVDPFWYREGHSKNPYVFINPKIIELEGETESEEGCLSLPGIFEKVPRAEKVVVEATNPEGERKLYTAEGLFAISIQHENDHLDGILFVDKIAKLRKMLIQRKINELKKTTDENGINIASE